MVLNSIKKRIKILSIPILPGMENFFGEASTKRSNNRIPVRIRNTCPQMTITRMIWLVLRALYNNSKFGANPEDKGNPIKDDKPLSRSNENNGYSVIFPFRSSIVWVKLLPVNFWLASEMDSKERINGAIQPATRSVDAEGIKPTPHNNIPIPLINTKANTREVNFWKKEPIPPISTIAAPRYWMLIKNA